MPQKATATARSGALLSAIWRSQSTVRQREWEGQKMTHLRPLPELLLDVLGSMDRPESLYRGLKSDSTFDISIFGK